MALPYGKCYLCLTIKRGFISASNLLHVRTRTLYILLGLSVTIALALPLDERWLLPCPLHRLTGWQCPLCGGQRLIRSLLRGDFMEAWLYNPALMCALPVLILWALRMLFPAFATRHPRLTLAPLFTERAFWLYVALAIVWGIVRNFL